MITKTGAENLYADLTNDSTSGNVTNGLLYINNEIRETLGSRDWPFLEKSATATTTASTQFYALPYDFGKLINVTITSGSIIYTPKLVESADFWDRLNYSTAITSNIPEWFYIFNGQLGFWPIPSSSSLTITYRYKRKVRDLNVADDTSRTITTLANGSTALTVSAGLTTQMAGFWLRPTFSTTANTGDGYWYELASITNATTATLSRAYGGVSITAGTAASTIAQVIFLPEEYQTIPIFKAVAQYYRKNGDKPVADDYDGRAVKLLDQMHDDYGSKTSTRVVRRGVESDIILNPNVFITA